MKNYLKLLSVILALMLILTSISLFGVSAESTYTQPEKFIYGDVDMDSVVTVKDATLVQKGVAGITYVTVVQRFLADPMGDGFNVKNATAIQKYLAGVEVGATLGEELDMSSQDEFSGEISTESNFSGEYISIISKDMDCEYTLEDFPEYSFSKIKKNELVSSDFKYISYELYLQEPSEENVLEAVKALDYRANIDLNGVYVIAYGTVHGLF